MIPLLATAGTAAALAALLIRLLRPTLLRYALAAPNARSSHRAPTPQGGGLAVVAAALAVGAGALALHESPAWPDAIAVGAAAACLAGLGLADDLRPLPPLARLVVQIACVAAIVGLAPSGRLLPEPVPLLAERALLTLAGVWWVNAVNFMDGIDWMTVAAFGPMLGALCVFGLAGHVSPQAAFGAAALLGALAGFAPSNRPVAQLFLGDVGSLPIGLLSGSMLLDLAAAGGAAAALLLALYYLADTTLTLARRLGRGERVWEAHRSHFYQRALGNGWSVLAIDRRVALLNGALAALAFATLRWPGAGTAAVALGAGCGLVGLTLFTFARSPRS